MADVHTKVVSFLQQTEKFRVITDILSSDEQGTEGEGESGKYDTRVHRKALAGRNGGLCSCCNHCC